jgi:hypothetical protein
MSTLFHFQHLVQLFFQTYQSKKGDTLRVATVLSSNHTLSMFYPNSVPCTGAAEVEAPQQLSSSLAL